MNVDDPWHQWKVTDWIGQGKTYPGDVPLHIAEASVTVVLKIPFFILKNIPFIELGRGIPALNASHCGQGKEATKKGEE